MLRLALLVAAGLLAGCQGPLGADTNPQSPEFQQESHTYEMGCQSPDFQGYEHLSLYCGDPL